MRLHSMCFVLVSSILLLIAENTTNLTHSVQGIEMALKVVCHFLQKGRDLGIVRCNLKNDKALLNIFRI